MPSDNVIPIERVEQDEVADRVTTAGPRRDRSRVRLRWMVVALAVVWAGAFGYAVTTSPMPSVWMVAAFAVMVIAAEHRFVLFNDETSMSASIVVILCAVGYWAPQGNFVAPMVVALAGGLVAHLLRAREYSKITLNAFGMSIAALAASATLKGTEALLTGVESRILVAAALGCFAYWTVNNMVVSIFLVTQGSGRVLSNLRCLEASDTEGVFVGGVSLWMIASAHLGNAGSILLALVAGFVTTAVALPPASTSRFSAVRTVRSGQWLVSLGAGIVLVVALAAGHHEYSVQVVIVLAVLIHAALNNIPHEPGYVLTLTLMTASIGLLGNAQDTFVVAGCVGVTLLCRRNTAISRRNQLAVAFMAMGVCTVTGFMFDLNSPSITAILVMPVIATVIFPMARLAALTSFPRPGLPILSWQGLGLIIPDRIDLITWIAVSGLTLGAGIFCLAP